MEKKPNRNQFDLFCERKNVFATNSFWLLLRFVIQFATKVTSPSKWQMTYNEDQQGERGRVREGQVKNSQICFIIRCVIAVPKCNDWTIPPQIHLNLRILISAGKCFLSFFFVSFFFLFFFERLYLRSFVIEFILNCYFWCRMRNRRGLNRIISPITTHIQAPPSFKYQTYEGWGWMLHGKLVIFTTVWSFIHQKLLGLWVDAVKLETSFWYNSESLQSSRACVPFDLDNP